MEPLLKNLHDAFGELKTCVARVKKHMDLVCCVKHDDRVDQAYDAFSRVNQLMLRLEQIGAQLAREERETLAAEYQYFFGHEHENPYQSQD